VGSAFSVLSCIPQISVLHLAYGFVATCASIFTGIFLVYNTINANQLTVWRGGGMFMLDYRELSWWYWLVTACLLTAGVAGYLSAFILAIGLTVFQLIHFTIRERSLTAFPVQVRFWYLLLLLLALPRPLQIIYWIPAIGTWAQLIFGYCTLARCVSLLPWNHKQPFSLALLRRTFMSRPVRGNVLQGLPRAS
jgi:hypothetical protein